MELDNLITSFKSANQSLRKRAIALGILMILAIALRYSENTRYKKVIGLMDYQYALEQVAELPDSTFRMLINGDWELEKKYFLSELNTETAFHYSLFKQIKLNNYKRDLIIEEIANIDQKIENCNQQQSIGLLGMTIPLEPVAYLSLIFVLIVFHDFTQIMIIRNRIYRRIRGRNLSQWELGFEFFGFHIETNNSTLKFLRFTSSLIIGVLVTCPLITSYLMMDLNNSNNSFLFFLNLICFLLIIVDTIILFHVENIGNFRYFCNFFLGRHNISRLKMIFFWACSLSLILVVNIALGAVLISEHGMAGVWFCLMNVVPPVSLFLALIYTQKNPTKKNRAVRAGLILLNVFWIFITYRSLAIFDRLLDSEHEIDELAQGFFVIIIFCLVYSFVYIKFFMDSKRIVKNRIVHKPKTK